MHAEKEESASGITTRIERVRYGPLDSDDAGHYNRRNADASA
jgi:hypothetical protein